MRYWQYDDEADWLNGSTRDDRRRAPSTSSKSSTSFGDHHRWLALCRNCRGQNLNSNLTLTKVHQVEVLQSESKSKMEVEAVAGAGVVGFGLWPTANATSTARATATANYARFVFIIFSREHNNSLLPQVDNVSIANDIRFEHAGCFKTNIKSNRWDADGGSRGACGRRWRWRLLCLEWSGSSSRRMQICCNILASLGCLRSAHQKEAAHSTTLFIPCKQNEHSEYINDTLLDV